MHYNTFDKENTSLGLSKIYQDPFKEATFISHEGMHIISCLLPYSTPSQKKAETNDPGCLEVPGPKIRRIPHFASQFENLRLKF